MAKTCPACGATLNDNARFCKSCGTSIADQETLEFYTGDPYQNVAYSGDPFDGPIYAGRGPVRQGIPAPGFSDRVEHPEILAAVRKNRHGAKIFGLFFVPLPIIGFLIYALISDKMEISKALLYGGIVSGVFLIFALFGFFRDRAKNSYEADVIDKKTRTVYRNRNSDSSSPVTEYTTLVRTTAGKTKKIVEWEGSRIWAYNYLNVGDRFRYHPQFNFPYERYDKVHADGIYCISCQTKNDINADRCVKCNLPLLK